MQDSVSSVINTMNSLTSRRDGDPVFSDSRYKTYPLDDKNFHEIKEASCPRISFIDGGNATLLDASDFSLSIVRVYANIFDGEEKIFRGKRTDFFVLTYSDYEDSLLYKTRIFPFGSHSFLPKEEDLVFDAIDPSLREGFFAGKINKLAQIARRFAEWRLAENMVEKLDEGDIVCLDGTLQTGFTNESAYAESAYKRARKAGVIFTGLSKSSSIFTTTGNNLFAVLKRRGPEKPWYYNPIADINKDDHKAEIFAVRLHENARHVFRFEIYREQKMKIERALSALLLNSKDFRFPGYPYGLLDADSMARITDSEKRYHSTLFLAASQNLGDHLATSDAHDIINRIVK